MWTYRGQAALVHGYGDRGLGVVVGIGGVIRLGDLQQQDVRVDRAVARVKRVVVVRA